MTRPIIWKHVQQLVPYSKGFELQKALVQHKINNPNSALNWLLLLEHKPVYTTGRRQSEEETSNQASNLLFDNNRTPNFCPEIFRTLRGGQSTYHGPGQLVGYPILDLKSINLNTRMCVDLLMDLLAKILVHPVLPVPMESLNPKQDPSLPVGIFIGNESQKIASIGVQIKRRMTCHGFALNVTEESEVGFKSIVACGLKHTQMISIDSVLKQKQENSITPLASDYQAINVEDLIHPTVDLFGQLTGCVMKEMDSTCQELDRVGYQMVDQFLKSNQNLSSTSTH